MKTIIIEGMRCQHCVQAVKTALEAVEGVAAVEVDLTAKKATVEGAATNQALTTAIEDSGFDVIEIL